MWKQSQQFSTPHFEHLQQCKLFYVKENHSTNGGEEVGSADMARHLSVFLFY